jgi:nucleoside-diphosphate-sugar epimerase
MRALVMGGTRFVGLHLVWELARGDHDVTIVNRGQTRAEIPVGVRRITCDRKDHASLRRLLSEQEFDAVFDIMAYVPEDTRPLIDIFEGRCGRFVQVSTGSVYKQVDVFPWKEDFEKVTDNSEGDYGYNKQLIEEMLFEAHARTGFPVSVIRPGYIYGPDNSVYRESLFFDRVVKGRPVVIPGDGSYLTCFGYVDDLARLLILCATRKEAVGQAFNFSGEFAVPMNEYMEKIFAACGRRVPMAHFRPEDIGLSDADVRKVFPYRWRSHTLRDISKAIYLLGYKEQVSLGDGLKAAFQWFLKAGIERKSIDFSLEDRIIQAVSAGS